MSSKRRWDQPAEGGGDKGSNDAAAAAAAIAAKIAAQFSSGAFGSGEDAEYVHDIDINDVRNRYLLTKGTTQQQIHDETGASVATKGVWYPDRSKATERDPPLYLHIMAPTKEILNRAVDKINELISLDMGSLVEDKKERNKRKWPEEKLPVGLESIRNFNVRAKVVGPSGSFVKYIQQETSTRVQIKGQGSGFIDQETGKEGDEPLYIHITGPEESQVARAKVLTEDLLLVVRSEHAKAAAVVQQQQMELHQAQAQYAAYAMAQSGYGQQPPPPPGSAPPPPDQPPPPPDGAAPAQQQPPQMDFDTFVSSYAAYGYDINSQQFRDWAKSQYDQYYGAAAAPAAAAAAPAPPGEAPAQPPPPPPPA